MLADINPKTRLGRANQWIITHPRLNITWFLLSIILLAVSIYLFAAAPVKLPIVVKGAALLLSLPGLGAGIQKIFLYNKYSLSGFNEQGELMKDFSYGGREVYTRIVCMNCFRKKGFLSQKYDPTCGSEILSEHVHEEKDNAPSNPKAPT